MERCIPLPIPILGKSWDGSFQLKTSGTTGKEKTVTISQKAVLANSENLIESQGYSQDTVFVIAGAITHLGSWSKIFPTLIKGGTLIVLPDMKDVNAFFQALDYPSDHLATFLVPANIRMLLRFSQTRLASYANRIDFIETGGAPIAQEVMKQLCATLPQTRLYNTYASTEAGIVATYNYNDGVTRAKCVGFPLSHSSVRIDANGRIMCQGDTLMQGCTQVLTSDAGHFDSDGRLYIDGRIDDILNIGGYKVNPLEVENAAMSYTTLVDCICTTTNHKILGPVLKLFVQLDEGATLDRHSLAKHILSKVERYKVPQLYEQVSHIERTFNGKLNRKFYIQ